MGGIRDRVAGRDRRLSRKVLKKHWADVKRFSDVTQCGRHNLEPVDVISGGFPCQEISFAGNREGIGTPENPTERSGLWFEFLRIVGEIRPRWVIVENVPGLKNLGADKVLSDMEALDTPAGRSYWELTISGHRTRGKGSGYSATKRRRVPVQ